MAASGYDAQGPGEVPEPLACRLRSDTPLDEATNEFGIRLPEGGRDPMQVAALFGIEPDGQ